MDRAMSNKSPEPTAVQPQTHACVRIRPLLAHEKTDDAVDLWYWESEKLFKKGMEGPPLFEGGPVRASTCSGERIGLTDIDLGWYQVYGPEAATEALYQASILPAVQAAFRGTTATV
jgi:hypothetical protein